MLSAIELINASLPGMIERGCGQIVNVTSHMVKAWVAMHSLSNGARAGLTGYVSGVARDVARHNATINNLLPGQFDTQLIESSLQHFKTSRAPPAKAATNHNTYPSLAGHAQPLPVPGNSSGASGYSSYP